jgi:hypothetical protein
MMSLLIPAAEFGINRRTSVGKLLLRFDINQTPAELMRG